MSDLEILTLAQVAQLLQMSTSQVYTMCRARAQARMPVPLPVIRINGNLRFRRRDIEIFIEKLAQKEAS